VLVLTEIVGWVNTYFIFFKRCHFARQTGAKTTPGGHQMLNN